MISAPEPRDRGDFHIVIICALALEAECVYDAFDKTWDSKRYSKAASDDNAYTLGAFGEHNVVLIHMPGMGTDRAVAAVTGLRSSFEHIRLTLVVGICGGMPYGPQNEEIILGDVVISDALIRYDLGRLYPHGFERKTGIHDVLGPPTEKILALLKKLETKQARAILQDNVMMYLEAIQDKSPDIVHPGLRSDILYYSSYLHQHHAPKQCEVCEKGDGACKDAIAASCEELRCDTVMSVTRLRLADSPSALPKIHLGTMASGNTVIKSGHRRDALAKEGVIAVEMEGAGAWRYGPTIVIKGVCDYADSHKQKAWQQYAAATAAACAKAFLLEWTPEKRQDNSDKSSRPVWHVPFDSMPGFVGRENEVRDLEQRLFEPQGRRTVSLLGLGGVGKSRLALELALRIRSRFPSYSILWVQASDQSTFENDMLEIGIRLGIPDISIRPGIPDPGIRPSIPDIGIRPGIPDIEDEKADEKADVKTLVKQQLSNSEYQWVLVLDNADDTTLWGRRPSSGSTQTSLVQYLPRTTTGSILITTRSRHVANFLAETEIIELSALPPAKATEMFIGRLEKADLAADRNALSSLLDQLTYLPLALVQAASYINKTQRPIQIYIDLMAKSENQILRLLNQDFGDRSRYYNAINPVAATWLISFEHIQTYYPLAAAFFCRMACLHEKGIPVSLLLDNDSDLDDVDIIDALAILTGYSFVTRQAADNRIVDIEERYDMHRLVRLAARDWLKREGKLFDQTKACTVRLERLFPHAHYENKNEWKILMPHAQHIYRTEEVSDLPERYYLLMKMGQCFFIDGEYHDAVKAFQTFVDWREKVSDTTNLETLTAYRALGRALTHQGNLSEAEIYVQKALHGRSTQLGLENADTLASMHDLAMLYREQELFSKAEKICQELVHAAQTSLGEGDPQALVYLNDLAVVLIQREKYAEAESMIRKATALQEATLGEDHSDTLQSMNILAETMRLQKSYSEAEGMNRKVLQLREMALGRNHPATLTTLNNLAITLSEQGRHDEAELMHREVLQSRESILGETHAHTLQSMQNLISSLMYQGRDNEALSMTSDLVRLRLEILPPGQPDIPSLLALQKMLASTDCTGDQ